MSSQNSGAPRASFIHTLKRFTRGASLPLLAIATAGSINAHAEDNSALLEILQRKGLLSADEAATVRRELAADKGDSGSKIKISPSVTELKLYGDLRLRYQYDNRDGQLDPYPVGVHQDGNEKDRSPSGSQQSRWRFRLRLGAEFKFGEQWFGGVELSTAQASDTGNQTFENGFDDYNIYISKAFLGWKPSEAFTLTAGKFTNPFYTTELVWDSDITPNGLAEVIKFDKLFSSAAEDGFDKDGKTIRAKKVESPWELSLVAGQFLFDDNLENNFDNDESTDSYLFQTQLVGSYKFANGVKLTFAPGWLVENAGSLSGLQNSQPFNDSPNVSGATRNINLLLAPGDVSFKLAGHKAKFLWDFAYNIEGSKRFNDIYDLAAVDQHHETVDDIAFLAGFQFGENRKGDDWSLLAYYRQAGVSSIDPNLNDSDFAASRLNTRGFKTSLAYNFTDFAIGALTWQYAWNLRDNLVGGQATSGAAIADSNDISILQVDFTLKF
jgi:hypothetical protein